MFSSSKLDVDQLNRCVKHYHFLSPRFSISCFPDYSQRTPCNFSFRYQPTVESEYHVRRFTSVPKAKQSSPFWKIFSSWKASCEGNESLPSATDRIKEIEEKLRTNLQSTIVSEVDIQNYLAKETGKDRLIKMFSKDHLGNPSPEAKFIYLVLLQSSAVTFFVVSLLASRKARQEFIERNKATVFNTRFQAVRRLQDAMLLAGIKDGVKWTARVSLFTASFLLISQSIAAYRNKSSPLEYSLASGCVGLNLLQFNNSHYKTLTIGALKVNMGLRGFLVGTGFGAVVGLVAGFLVLGAMHATNETQEQRHWWQIQKELEKDRYYETKGKLPEGL